MPTICQCRGSRGGRPEQVDHDRRRRAAPAPSRAPSAAPPLRHDERSEQDVGRVRGIRRGTARARRGATAAGTPHGDADARGDEKHDVPATKLISVARSATAPAGRDDRWSLPATRCRHRPRTAAAASTTGAVASTSPLSEMPTAASASSSAQHPTRRDGDDTGRTEADPIEHEAVERLPCDHADREQRDAEHAGRERPASRR